MYPRDKKTKQLLELTMANHNSQVIYKQVSDQLKRQWLAKGVSLGVNIITFMPLLGFSIYLQ